MGAAFVPQNRREGPTICRSHDLPGEAFPNTATPRFAKGCPALAVPILMRRIDASTLSGELRARGIRALAASGSLDAMRWIAQRTVKKHWLLRTPVLREKSPQLISSIAGLAAHWSSAPEAAEVLALVAKSKDTDLRTAAARTGAA